MLFRSDRVVEFWSLHSTLKVDVGSFSHGGNIEKAKIAGRVASAGSPLLVVLSANE